jgi:O-antigen/teichoic acid export membrane protein
MGIMIMLIFPLIIGGIILAPEIITFVYGESFVPSILVFQILILTTAPIFLSSPLGNALIISNQQKKTFLITLSGAAINIILNIILIPKFSLYGAAAATLITYMFIMFLFFISIFKYTQIKPLNLKIFASFFPALISGLIMIVALVYFKNYNFNVLYLIFFGAFVYFLFFWSANMLMKKISFLKL